MRSNYTQSHSEEHYPIDKREDARIVNERLVEHDHRSSHENRLYDIGPGRQCLCACLLHFTQGYGTHSNEDGVQDEEDQGDVVIIGVLMSVLLMIAISDQERCKNRNSIKANLYVRKLLRQDHIG